MATWLGLIATAASFAGCRTAERPAVKQPAPPLLPGEGESAAPKDGPNGVAVEGAGAAAGAALEPAHSAEPAATAPAVAADDQAEGDRATKARTSDPSDEELRAEAGRVLDDWHEAASVGDRDRYLGHFALDGVFLGTDRTERWDLAEFSAYVDEYFAPGRGWTYVPKERYVTLGPGRDVAWFDEQLDSEGYGELRGSGALRREDGEWRITLYSMTFTIPNDVARDVVRVVREAQR